jgi:hypothetical protein
MRFVGQGAFEVLKVITPLGFFASAARDAQKYGTSSKESIVGFTIATLTTAAYIGAFASIPLLVKRPTVDISCTLSCDAKGQSEGIRINRTNNEVTVPASTNSLR